MYLLEKYSKKPWDWYWISKNPNITMEFIEKYPNKPWNWRAISMNPAITMEIIKKYPNKPWSWSCMSKNPNITLEIIKKYIDKISFERLSQNKLTLENTRIKKTEAYLLLEKERSFHNLMNLFIVTNYM